MKYALRPESAVHTIQINRDAIRSFALHKLAAHIAWKHLKEELGTKPAEGAF